MEAYNQKTVKAYGISEGDALVRLSFSLPIKNDEQAESIGLAYSHKIGFKKARVTYVQSIGPQLTSFIVYGELDSSMCVDEAVSPDGNRTHYYARSPQDISKETIVHLGRRATLLSCVDSFSEQGALFESVVTLGGSRGQMGLEAYPTFQVKRMRDLASLNDLVDGIKKAKPDVILIKEPESGWGQGPDALKALAKKIKGCKEVPDWCVKVCWCVSPAEQQTALNDYDISCDSSISSGELASRIIAQLIENKMGRENGESGEKKKQGFMRWFSRS
jgi:hypothetical protein